MRIISDKKCGMIVADSISKYPDAIRITALYATWKKLLPFIVVISFALFFTLVKFTHIINLILDYFGLQSLPLLLRLLFLLVFTLSIDLVMIIIHEFIHLLGYIKDFKYCYLVISKKAVSVYNGNWVTKRNHLIALILPVLFFLLAAVIILIITKNFYLFYCITLLNLVSASSDIVVFSVFLIKAPKNSLILGHYYRTQ